jgi:putative oxidoreductase
MNEQNLVSIGAAVSRIALGLVVLAHSLYLKLVVYTLPGTAQFFDSIGLPAALAYLVFITEAAAGVMLLAGWRVRLASLTLVPILLGATWAHWQSGWLFTNANGGWEYPAFLAAIALAQAFLGRGAFALADVLPRRHAERRGVAVGS